MDPKYKVGDKVRIRSKEWYDSHKNKFGKVWTKSLSGEYNVCFDQDFVKYCGREAVIFSVEPENYTLKGIPYAWTDEMLEAVNTDSPIMGLMPDSEGYELMIHEDYEVKQKDGKFYLVKKRPSYPKTYADCCDVLRIPPLENDVEGYKWELLAKLQELFIARDAYWKLYGEEMNLGKPWEPEDENTFSIFYDRLADEISRQDGYNGANSTFEFPTAEIRDQFHDNFGPDLEKIKKIL